MVEQRRRRFVRWAVFAVLVALAPFGVQLLFAWTKKLPITWDALCQTFKDGDLLLTAAALAADALGEMVVASKVPKTAKALSGGGCFLLAAAASAWYGQIRTSGLEAQLSQDRICEGSVVILLLTLILAVVCKVW